MRDEALDLTRAGDPGGVRVISRAYLTLLACASVFPCFWGGFHAGTQDTGEQLSHITSGVEALIGVSCTPVWSKVPSTHVGVSRTRPSENPMVPGVVEDAKKGGYGRITFGICYESGGNKFSGGVAIGECEHHKRNKFYWAGRGN